LVLAAPMISSPAMAAAREPGASSTYSSGTVGVAASGGVVGCGWNRASCEEDRRIFSRAGVKVSDIYLCDGCTYPPESSLPEGYFFFWGTRA
jgi:hypothetical protein